MASIQGISKKVLAFAESLDTYSKCIPGVLIDNVALIKDISAFANALRKCVQVIEDVPKEQGKITLIVWNGTKDWAVYNGDILVLQQSYPTFVDLLQAIGFEVERIETTTRDINYNMDIRPGDELVIPKSLKILQSRLSQTEKDNTRYRIQILKMELATLEKQLEEKKWPIRKK